MGDIALGLSKPELTLSAEQLRSYGRLSGSRGNSYTMVFSRLCAADQAKLIRCSHSISTSQELIAEAEHLWKAEQPRAKAHRIATDWGCVALLFNPKRQIPRDLLNGWAERVKGESEYGNVSQTQAEGELVSENGLLQIDWPQLVAGGEADVDLILVTARRFQILAITQFPNMGHSHSRKFGISLLSPLCKPKRFFPCIQERSSCWLVSRKHEDDRRPALRQFSWP
jgi:hypothetical protein